MGLAQDPKQSLAACGINQPQLPRRELCHKVKRGHDDTPMRLSTSVSPKMSEMSSTGRDSKVNIAVEGAEAGNPNLRQR